jgi:agmatinase
VNTPALIGICFDDNSSYLRGPAEAPPLIREALRSDHWNLWTETASDLGPADVFRDRGDLQKPTFDDIQREVAALIGENLRPLCLGGDHSVTYPIMRAVGARTPDLTIVHFDAHPDLYDQLDGNRLSHACPFARIMEEKLASRLIQIGIRTMNGHQREQAARFGVEVVHMRDLPAFDKLAEVRGPVYISFDIDVLDPAFAPGISHREPGGMSVREAIAHLHAIGGDIVGADIVEYNPRQDVSGMTATVAAKVLKEILGRMVTQNR